jgi:hypothetical protein
LCRTAVWWNSPIDVVAVCGGEVFEGEVANTIRDIATKK